MDGDPLTAPFWAAAAEHRLLIQGCAECGRRQFYPRPFCLGCQSDRVEWVPARGTGTIYSVTTVRVEVLPELPPPYRVAVIELDEGPRLLSQLVGAEGAIGQRVRVAWREREGRPPLPVFEVEARAAGAGEGRGS